MLAVFLISLFKHHHLFVILVLQLLKNIVYAVIIFVSASFTAALDLLLVDILVCFIVGSKNIYIAVIFLIAWRLLSGLSS